MSESTAPKRRKLPSEIANKFKRAEVYGKQRLEKKKEKRERRNKRKREEEELGAAAPPKQVSFGVFNLK
jgi:hypothetical protein